MRVRLLCARRRCISAWIAFFVIACFTIPTLIRVQVLPSYDGTTSDVEVKALRKTLTYDHTIFSDAEEVTDSNFYDEMTTGDDVMLNVHGAGSSDFYSNDTMIGKPLILVWNPPNAPLTAIPTMDTCGGGCELSNDHSRIRESNAVVFHMDGHLGDDIPERHSRNSNQVYVWWSEDSPWISKHMYNLSSDLEQVYDKDFFNWTMTYKPSSDVNAMMIPYTAIDFVLQRINGNGGKMVLPSNTREEIDRLKTQAKKMIRKKSKMAIWISSNCGYTAAAVLRRKIVTDLQFQGLKVDVFGQCGDTKIPDDLAGYLNLISKYKFSLAFENALHCKGYISEKFWYNGLYAGTIPVVWGPIKSDLAAVAPVKSFIHYDDFTSSESLIQHLHHVSKNKTKYMEYLSWWWKSPGNFPVYGVTEFRKDLKGRRASYDFELNAFCNLCYLLSRETHLKTKKTVRSIQEWWYAGEGTTCLDRFHNVKIDRYGISFADGYQVFKYDT